jgi:hypothetical protein
MQEVSLVLSRGCVSPAWRGKDLPGGEGSSKKLGA